MKSLISLKDFEYIGAPGGGEDNVEAKDIFWNAKGLLYEKPKKEDIRDARTYSEQIEDKYSEQLAMEIEAYYAWLLNQMISKGDGRTGEGLYSKLSTVNINNGQDSTFSFDNSCKDKPAPSMKQSGDGNNTYRPLPDCLTIKESSIDGLGLFTTRYLERGTVLGKSHHYMKTPYSEDLVRTALGSFANHSSEPNCTIEECDDGMGNGWSYKSYNLVALRSIAENEELTLDYRVELCGLSGYDGAEFLKE